jgi:protein phosphatase
MFEIGHINHPGKKRRLNEDSYDIDVSHGIALLVDGMGGANAGDIAGAFVRENLYKSLRQGDRPVDALINTGQALRIQRPQQGTSPCGASAVAVRFDDKTLSSAWLGTCRSLHCNGTKTRVLTPLGTQENKSGGVGTIQALGLTATDKLSLIEAEEPWQRGHALLLCTDELLAACPLDRINDVLCNGRLSAQESAEQLLFYALQGSADNNLSVIVIRRN